MLTTALVASLAISAEARADYQVFCPASTTATWDGGAAGITSSIPGVPDQVNSGDEETRDLVCSLDSVTVGAFRDSASCFATVRFSGVNAVFGRTETFISDVFRAEGSLQFGGCQFTFAGGPIPMRLRMTESCEFNGDGRSWTCPDSAVPVFIP